MTFVRQNWKHSTVVKIDSEDRAFLITNSMAIFSILCDYNTYSNILIEVIKVIGIEVCDELLKRNSSKTTMIEANLMK